MCTLYIVHTHIYTHSEEIAYPTLVATHIFSILQSRWEQKIVKRITGYFCTPEI